MIQQSSSWECVQGKRNLYVRVTPACPCSLQHCSQRPRNGVNLRAHRRVGGWIKKTWWIYTMEYGSVFKKKENLSLSTTLRTWSKVKSNQHETNTASCYLHVKPKEVEHVETECMVVAGDWGGESCWLGDTRFGSDRTDTFWKCNSTAWRLQSIVTYTWKLLRE